MPALFEWFLFLKKIIIKGLNVRREKKKKKKEER